MKTTHYSMSTSCVYYTIVSNDYGWINLHLTLAIINHLKQILRL